MQTTATEKLSNPITENASQFEKLPLSQLPPAE
jgi:hypothetical protein